MPVSTNVIYYFWNVSMQNVIFAIVFKLTSAQEYSRVQGRTQDFISGGAGAYGECASTSL